MRVKRYKKMMQASFWKTKPSRTPRQFLAWRVFLISEFFLLSLCSQSSRLVRRFLISGVFSILAVLQFHTALKTSFPLEAVIFGQIEEPRFYLILISHSASRNHKRSGQMHCTAHLPAVFSSPNLACVRWIYLNNAISLLPTSSLYCFLNLFRRKLR